MLTFGQFILEMNVTDMGNGFSVHHHDLGDGHAAMVMFQRSNKGVAVDYTIHSPEHPSGTVAYGSIPHEKRTKAIMSVRRSIRNHLASNPTTHIDMHGTTNDQQDHYNRIGSKMGRVEKIGSRGGIRIHLGKKPNDQTNTH